MDRVAPFDAADYLDGDEVVSEYLNAALEDGDPDVFLRAVSDVARAKGMAKIAAEAGLGRESLYKALAPGAKPRYDTILKLMSAFGVKLKTTPAKSPPLPDGPKRGEYHEVIGSRNSGRNFT